MSSKVLQTDSFDEGNGVEDVVLLNDENCQQHRFLYPESYLASSFDNTDVAELERSMRIKNARLAVEPLPGFKIRPLCSGDYARGFTDVLRELTFVGNVTLSDFLSRFRSMAACPETYFVTVIEDIECQRVVGAATLVVEQKFIRSCAKRAMVEDVVVLETYRGRELGKILMGTMVLLAKKLGAYKINLTCNEDTQPFYAGIGFPCEKGSGINMTWRVSNK